ncbi:PepSY domain-containing protein [Burkholderia sp. Bp9012]|uniref:PepSY domain-containing protein n=1 Tax=Burkholderia sp. Bp9012 TaxID=2184562 RepID=UPI000F5A88B7|nr:PepSY domain-containing protein [Burkholderia sp. Bp9012]RQR85344.1 PepSY domain-containing protein [Burkholderia sp. Bp9012]
MRKTSLSGTWATLRVKLPWRATGGNKVLFRRPQKNLSMLLREWHRRIGIGAAVFMIWLGISGIMLNQSPSWGFDAKRIDWPWLMSLYGLHPEPASQGYRAAGHWLAVADGRLVIDGAALDVTSGRPVGFVVAGRGDERLFYIASASQLTIATTGGKLVDQLSGSSLPMQAIRRIGTTADGQGVVIGGDSTYSSADAGLSWKPYAGPGTVWSEPGALDAMQRNQVAAFARPSVPLEQILIDLHSGRVFGHAGEYVIDLVGAGAVVLAVSGIWIVWRSNRKRLPVRERNG